MEDFVYLTLSDGSVWRGRGRLDGPVEGEVVFTTASCGYPQTLTDPSYNGQIIVFAFPPIGIYGIDKDNLESRRVWARGALMTRLDETECGRFESLHDWMAENGRPIVHDIDTRGLILKIREVGSMMGRLDTTPVKPELAELPPTLVHEVSCGSPVISGGGDLTVAVMDYGVKENIIRSMERRGCRVIRFPHDTPADTVLGSGADGVLLSNGPGDPSVLEREAAEAAKLLGKLRQIAAARRLPRKSASRDGLRRKDEKAFLRPPRREPAGARPRHGARPADEPEPPVRGRRGEPRWHGARSRLQASRRRHGRGAAPQAVRRAVGAVPSRGFAGAGGRLLYFRQFHRPHEGRAPGEKLG